MSISQQEWRKEQQRVDRAIQTIQGRMAVLQKEVGGVKADIVEIRKYFWDDVTVNVDDPGEAAETYASIKQQAEVLSEREARHRHAQQRLKTLEKLQLSPYFGRIDFAEDEESSPQRIYLGLTSLLNENKEDFLVYDWRAPVSSLYYDYGPGPAQYEAPDGTVTGTMELKRQYIIRDGRIRGLFDTGVTIGDELLQEVLGQQAGTQMKTIVATIQREQNQIIRSEGKRLLIVQGAAGSGKTSAALQRVAYLLYRHRETLRADQILLFSPNPMFNSYVSTVLPELGEENMSQTTFQEYVERQLGHTFHLEDPFTQMEAVFATTDAPEVRMEGIRFKSSLDFMAILDRYLSRLHHFGLIFKHIKFRGNILVSAKQIGDHFYSLDQMLSIPQRLENVADWLLKELKKQARLEQTQPWVEEAIQYLDSQAYNQVYRKLLRKQSFTEDTFDDHDREQRLLAEGVVQERFKPLVNGVKQLRFIDIPAVYKQLFTDPTLRSQWSVVDLPQHWDAIARETAAKLNRSELFYEDATPYLYLKGKIEGFQTVSSVRHVLIDEAQDYSPFQFRFMKELFPRASFTMLGDLNQSIHPHAAGTDFASLSSLYGPDQTKVIRLTRSYRSTRPIVQFTRRIIPGGEAIEPFNRAGKKPTVMQASNKTELTHQIADRICELQAAGHRTIAVIGKTAQECREAFESLQDKVPLRLINQETASFQSGVVVIPSYLAKGVEFDAVILYDASRKQYGKKREQKLFYTACTRAMHELHLFYTGEKSPFLAQVPADLYEEKNN